MTQAGLAPVATLVDHGRSAAEIANEIRELAEPASGSVADAPNIQLEGSGLLVPIRNFNQIRTHSKRNEPEGPVSQPSLPPFALRLRHQVGLARP